MRFFAPLLTALPSLQTVSTIPQPTSSCATPTATVTAIRQHLHCGRYVCPPPSSVCVAGEPTGPTPRPPYVFMTATPAPHACTVTANAIDNPGCNLCPTCHVPAGGASVARATSTFSG
ncbi:hypothetical protein J7T55_009832 [Diaporthe amygdali]|uniref:uncharacterized protein n=1 Tax=Phomopsis amygdali TaxID=1214568 RepID=UPI0022FED836|nr:uncharacterized protein J7T55_009832 [Diaporthe amygdali]KAJ0116682.1 hypothetical protein J7T55_009832 [Diaporthe amygdali]